MRKIAAAVTILLLPCIIFLATFWWHALNMSYIQKEIEKLNIYEEFKNDRQQVDVKISEVISYLKDKKNILDPQYFSEREQLHMADVKKLMQKARLLTISLIILILLSMAYLAVKERPLLGKSLFYGSCLTFVLLFVLMITAKLAFSGMFIKFHELAFTNNYWQLDPAKDTIVKIFNEQFFMDFLKNLIYKSLALATIVLVVTIMIRKKLNAF